MPNSYILKLVSWYQSNWKTGYLYFIYRVHFLIGLRSLCLIPFISYFGGGLYSHNLTQHGMRTSCVTSFWYLNQITCVRRILLPGLVISISFFQSKHVNAAVLAVLIAFALDAPKLLNVACLVVLKEIKGFGQNWYDSWNINFEQSKVGIWW